MLLPERARLELFLELSFPPALELLHRVLVDRDVTSGVLRLGWRELPTLFLLFHTNANQRRSNTHELALKIEPAPARIVRILRVGFPLESERLTRSESSIEEEMP